MNNIFQTIIVILFQVCKQLTQFKTSNHESKEQPFVSFTLTSQDNYQKILYSMKKNFEAMLDADVFQHENNFTLLHDPYMVHQENLQLIYPGQEIFPIPKSVFELEDMHSLVNVKQLKEIFSREDFLYIFQFLPRVDSTDLETQISECFKLLESLLAGNNFDHGNPIDIFLNTMKQGFFTNTRLQESMIHQRLTIKNHIDHLENMKEHIDVQFTPDNLMTLKRKRDFSPTSSANDSLSNMPRKQILVDDSIDSTEEEYDDSGFFINQQKEDEQEKEKEKEREREREILREKEKLRETQIQTEIEKKVELESDPKEQPKEEPHANNNIVMQAIKRMINQKILKPNEGQFHTSSREWIINYRKQELERYKNPTKPFKFILEDGRSCVVGPAAKKLLSTQHAKPRQHELLIANRPSYVTILSLVRDAVARLANGYGTRTEVVNLVKDSQFINDNLPDDKVIGIISGALDRLHQCADPCVKFDAEKKIWMYNSTNKSYLHKDRDEYYPGWSQQGKNMDRMDDDL